MDAEQTLRYQELLDEYDLLLGPTEDDVAHLMRNVLAYVMVTPSQPATAEWTASV